MTLRLRQLGWPLIGVTAFSLCACGTDDVRPAVDPVADARAIAQGLNAATAVTARTTVVIHHAGQDDASCDLSWRALDPGRVLVEASAHDVTFGKAALDAHDAYLLILPRDKVQSAGTLMAPPAARPWLLTALQLAGTELLRGPVDPQRPMTPGASTDSVHLALPAGLGAELTIDRREGTVTSARIADASGALLVTVGYARYRAYDELRRPSILTLTFPDGTTATLYLRACASVGHFSDGALRLQPDTEYATIGLTEFMDHLEHQGDR